MFASYIVYATDVPEDMEGPAVFTAGERYIAPRLPKSATRRLSQQAPVA